MKNIAITFILLILTYFGFTQSFYFGETYDYVLRKNISTQHKTSKSGKTTMLNVRLSDGNYLYYFNQNNICFKLIYFLDKQLIADEIEKLYDKKFIQLANKTWLMKTIINGKEQEIIIQKQINFFVYVNRKDAGGW
jgi:hypothetical protein